MKIWIDISNAPHVRFFKDVIKYLESEGEDLIITARDFGDIHKLMNMYDIDFISVGKHGVSLYDKLKENNVKCELVLSVCGGHCFEKVHKLIEPNKGMDDIQEDIANFVLKYI